MTTIKQARFVSMVTERKYVMEKVFPALRPKTAKRTFTDEIGVPFLDLELYFRVAVLYPDGNEGSYILTEGVLKKTGLSLDEVKKCAKLNSNVVARSLGTLLNVKDNNCLYVLNNVRRRHGAGGAMVSTERLVALAKSLGENELFIIPSSIHEILAIPCKSFDEEEINEAIREVNAKEVLPEERLSNHVYRFNANTQEFAYSIH